ncbi:FkbM family methyltransferase [Hyphococcus sp. DH-69]|uniref:FkbM family methyltransferase n=1 Tax=Hyphococcus formosus TaxID=3143534 RepID=UPI00398AFE1A
MSDYTETKFDTIVHLGAGRGAQDDHANATARRTILVEANPETAEYLSAKNKDNPKVTVHTMAIAGKAGERVLNVFNFQRANSLNTPSGLKKLFPNIEIIKSLSLNAVSASDFISGLSLTEKERHLLIVDTPGIEHEILNALGEADLLRKFAVIKVMSTKNALYENSKTAKDHIAYLTERGFAVSVNSRDPDFPAIEAKLSQHFVELTQTRKALEDAKAEIARLEKIAQEAQFRSEKVDQEILKTEAQIDLIKDLLSRNKAS